MKKRFKQFMQTLIVCISLFTISAQAQEHTFCHTAATSSNLRFESAMKDPVFTCIR